MTTDTQQATRRVVIISPCRNEEDLLPQTIEAMEAQTLKPVLWLIVDDGSSDSTGQIAQAAAARNPWMRVFTRPDRGRRKVGGGVVDTFNDGLATVTEPYDFLCKLDADMTFGPRYIETLMEAFEANPKLGAASGKVYRPEGDTLVEEFMIDDMVAGQWKTWKRECFEDIGGLVPMVMWDGIDFHRARQTGWQTASIEDKRLHLIHHRLMGSSDSSVLKGRMRWGRGQWFMGSSPFYLIASAFWRMKERPYIIGGFLIWWGYVWSGIKGEERYENKSFRKELRQWQRGRLKRLVSRGAVR